MTEITTTNIDWRILADLQRALTSATRDGQAVFKRVDLSGDGRREALARPTGPGPLAAIAYRGDSEHPSLEATRCRQIKVRIHLAARSASVGSMAERLRGILDLLALVRNAIEAEPPDDACAWFDRYGWREKLAWSETFITDRGDGPWILAAVDLSVTCALADGTTH